MKYVIKRDAGYMLRELTIGRTENSWALATHHWTVNIQDAICFNREEAEATIEFITNTIDAELGNNLFWEEIE